MPFWILLLLMTLGVFAALIVKVLPAVFLKNSYSGGRISDRGLKKYSVSNQGYAIVYEPERAIRKYISKYVLFERSGKKFFLCDVASGIRYIDFDILLFDSDNNAFLSLNSRNLITEDGVVEEISLPERTMYVAISLNRVDSERFVNKRTIRMSTVRLIGYFVSAVAVSVGFAFVMKLCLSNLLAGVFREDFFGNTLESVLLVLVTLAAGIIASVVSLIFLLRRNRQS